MLATLLLPEMTHPEMLFACCVLAVGAWVQGNLGFGMGMVSAPILLLIDPRFVPGPLIACALVITFTVLVRERRSVDLKNVRWAMAGCFLGSSSAALLFSQLSERTYSLLFGVLVLLAVVLNGMGHVLRSNQRTLALAGIAGGFMGTLSSIGGPPIVMAFQEKRGATLRGTLSAYFLFSTTIALINLTLAGKFHTSDWSRVAVLLPGVVFGLFVSHFTRGLFDQRSARPAILGLSTLTAIVVLVRVFAS